MNSRSKPRRRSVEPVERLEPRLALAVSVVTPLPNLNAGVSATTQTISLANAFDDTAVTGTVVKFTNNAATNNQFYVELFDKAGPARTITTPLSATNFLSYVDDGSYANTIIHQIGRAHV